MTRAPLISLSVVAALASGCGGGSHHATATQATDVPELRAQPPPSVAAAKPPPRKPPRPVHAPPPRPLAGGNLGFVTHGPRTGRRLVALTFDADMTPAMLARLRAGAVRGWYDRSIVDYLRATHTPATIFLTGLWARTYSRVVQALSADPLFELENHSYDHAAFEPQCYGLGVVAAPNQKLAEVHGAKLAIEAAGAQAPRYFRFPGGCHSAADLRLVASEGERPVGWDVVSGDPFQPNPQVVVNAVESGVQPGSIVVMHIMGAPNAPATSRALRQIVPALESRGFKFVTLRRVLRG
jgi:peptidoglycan-N-acetylglucosamine deacetylase